MPNLITQDELTSPPLSVMPENLFLPWKYVDVKRNEGNAAWHQFVDSAHATYFPQPRTEIGERALGALVLCNSRWVQVFLHPESFKYAGQNSYRRRLAAYLHERLEATAALSEEDLLQVGLVSLCHAISTWKPHHASLTSYSKTGIGRVMVKELDDIGRTVRLPTNVQTQLRQSVREQEILPPEDGSADPPLTYTYLPQLDQGSDDGRRPLFDVIAQTETVPLEMTPDEEGYDLDEYQARYIDDENIGLTPAYDEIAPSWSDNQGVAYNFSPGMIRELLNELPSETPERDREIILLRYGFKDGKTWTYDEIAAELGGISRSGVGEVLNRVAKQLHLMLNIKLSSLK